MPRTSPTRLDEAVARAAIPASSASTPRRSPASRVRAARTGTTRAIAPGRAATSCAR
jgi:hypothetical protein